MNKYTYLTLGIIVLTIFLVSGDVIAQTQGEEEVVRITERVLDMVLGFFKSILVLIGDFLKDLIPFFGGEDTPTEA